MPATLLLLFTKDLDARRQQIIWQRAYSASDVLHFFNAGDQRYFAVVHRSASAAEPTTQFKQWAKEFGASEPELILCVGYHGGELSRPWLEQLRQISPNVYFREYTSSATNNLWDEYAALATALQKTPRQGATVSLTDPAKLFDALMEYFSGNNLFSALHTIYVKSIEVPFTTAKLLSPVQQGSLKGITRLNKKVLKELGLLPQA